MVLYDCTLINTTLAEFWKTGQYYLKQLGFDKKKSASNMF